MPMKTDLLRSLGWDDDLIQHFMVDDSDYEPDESPELVAEVFDSHSVIINFSAENSGSGFVING